MIVQPLDDQREISGEHGMPYTRADTVSGTVQQIDRALRCGLFNSDHHHADVLQRPLDRPATGRWAITFQKGTSAPSPFGEAVYR